MDAPVFILINPNSCQGKGWKKWKAIRQQVLNRLPGAREMVTTHAGELPSLLSRIMEKNDESRIISAGGDGSIHAIANILLHAGKAQQHVMGAVGLGSSNDFLKPFQTLIGKIPVRINTAQPPVCQDAGEISYTDEKGVEQKKYFIVNASLGVTAEGNWNFNHPGMILKWLKRSSTGMAITFTALKTIFTYRNKPARIHFNGTERQIQVSNINILKIPYVAGSLYYRQAVLPDDGQLGLNICMDMNRIQLIQTLMQLEKGKFKIGDKRLSIFVDRFGLSADNPIIFECDGETAESSSINVSVKHKAIRLLTP